MTPLRLLACQFNRRGVALHERGHRDRALASYSVAIRLAPELEVARFNRGQCHLEMGSVDLALADYNAAIGMNRGRARAFYDRSVCYLKLGLIEQAVADYVEARELDPYETDVFCRWGLGYDQWENDTIVSLTEELRHAPDYAKYYLRGYHFALIGAREAAVVDYTESIRLKPDNATTYSQRGQAYHILGNWDAALADYTEALRLRPDSTTLRGRGLVYMKKAEWDQAIADFTEAIRLEPTCGLLYINRGDAYQAKGEPELARADRDRARELNA